MRHSNLLFALVLFAAFARGEETTHLVAATPSKLVLQGSSNVASWRCVGSTVDGRMYVAAPIGHINAVIDHIEDGDVARLTTPSFPLPKFQMRIPVSTLRCGNRQMERDMVRALRAEKHPTIDFQFADLVGGVRHDIDAHTYGARIRGMLTLAGTQREMAIDVVANRVSQERFRLQARLPMRMTDFRIEPPTALFGMIKARNDLVVQFDLLLEVKDAQQDGP